MDAQLEEQNMAGEEDGRKKRRRLGNDKAMTQGTTITCYFEFFIFILLSMYYICSWCQPFVRGLSVESWDGPPSRIEGKCH